MNFVELTENEYQKYWENHPEKTFLSAIEIAKLRKKSNWNVYYLGVKQDKKIIAGAMLLSHKRHFNSYEFYSPRGFLLDYHNEELLSFFTENVKRFVKEKNGYVLRIDPYIINKERNLDGNLVEGGVDNTSVITSLYKLGFKKVPLSNTEQVSWMFSLNLEGKTADEILKEMKQNTRNIIRKTEKIGIKIKELSYEELPEFQNIMLETGTRKGFSIRDASYYEEMYKLLHDKDEVKYFITYLDLNEYIAKLESERAEKQEKYDKGQRKGIEIDIDLLEKRISEAKAIKEETKQDVITLSCAMFILIKPEIIYLSGGNYEKYMNFNSQYLLQWKMIKYGIDHGFKKHNFYGIPANIQDHPKDYGIYAFKRGFNGQVEELIGEYELPISPKYFLFKIIHKIKGVKK